MTDRTPIASARICRDCTNLVTTDETCPLCNKSTEPHPDREKKEDWCAECAGGLFQTSAMHLITWNEDATMQIEDGDLMMICDDCRDEKEGENW